MVTPTLLVLAAGMGSRYGGLKELDPVGPDGETILGYSIHDAHRAGFGKVVFIIRKEIEQPFKQMVGPKFEKRIAVEQAPAGILRASRPHPPVGNDTRHSDGRHHHS
jgi:CTP:molybdopterin cytidylyltransferase MocA